MSQTMRAASTRSTVPSLQSQSSGSPSKQRIVSGQSQTPASPTIVNGNGKGKGKGRELDVEVPPNGLLIPTDRERGELEEKWLGHLGRFRVHSEVVLHGYSLYSLRSWYVLLRSRGGRLMCEGICPELIGHRLLSLQPILGIMYVKFATGYVEKG